MNREQKRKFKANAKKHGFNDSEVEYLLNHEPNEDMLWEGAKVKLDTTWIRLSPDWQNNKLRKDYKDWVMSHKDDTFTVVFDEKRKNIDASVSSTRDPNFDIVVCLEEDATDPKWLFFAGDLILQTGGTPRPNDKETSNKIEVEAQVKATNEKIQDTIQRALEREKQ